MLDSEDYQSRVRQYREFDATTRKTAGFRVQVELDGLAESLKVLDGNTRELEDDLATFHGVLTDLVLADDPAGRAHISKINRRLQNYVWARMALVDHTRAALKRLGIGEGSTWYQHTYLPQRNAQLSDKGFKFLQDLRNYAAHAKYLPINAGIRSHEDGIEVHVSLDVERLLLAVDDG